jgi:hypothetical protein
MLLEFSRQRLHYPDSPLLSPRPSPGSSACTPCRLMNGPSFFAHAGLIQSTSLLGRECTGISLMELIHVLALTHLASSHFPTIFVDCLPRPHFSPRLPGHTAFAVLLVLHSRPSTDRTLLAASLALIGPLTSVPPEDSVSPPEVTRCSSVPCRLQTPWCGE